MFMPTDANAGTLQKVWIHAWPCLGVVCCTCKQMRRGEDGERRRKEWRGEEERGEKVKEECNGGRMEVKRRIRKGRMREKKVGEG